MQKHLMRIAVLLLALCFVSASQAAGNKSAERRLARQLEKAYKRNSSRELNRFMEEWSEKYSPNGPESGPMNDTLTAVYELFGSLYSPNLKREPDIWPDSLFPARLHPHNQGSALPRYSFPVKPVNRYILQFHSADSLPDHR